MLEIQKLGTGCFFLYKFNVLFVNLGLWHTWRMFHFHPICVDFWRLNVIHPFNIIFSWSWYCLKHTRSKVNVSATQGQNLPHMTRNKTSSSFKKHYSIYKVNVSNILLHIFSIRGECTLKFIITEVIKALGKQIRSSHY